MYVCMHIYIYVHIHAGDVYNVVNSLHPCIYIYIYMYINTYVHKRIRMYTYMQVMYTTSSTRSTRGPATAVACDPNSEYTYI